MLDVKISTMGNNKVVSLIGELDIATVDKFRNIVNEMDKDDSAVVFDLGSLNFIDSTGVGGLLTVVRGLKGEHRQVKLRKVSEEVYEVLDLLGIPVLMGKEVFEG